MNILTAFNYHVILQGWKPGVEPRLCGPQPHALPLRNIHHTKEPKRFFGISLPVPVSDFFIAI